MANETPDNKLRELATELTIAWVSNPNTTTATEDVPAALQSIYGALATLATGQAAEEIAFAHIPAVSVRRSLASKDHLISLIDGKPYRMLKRHLSMHGLTPAQYRERYDLKPDYPMVAESYAEKRRDMAKKVGLGRTLNAKVTLAAPTPQPLNQPE